MNLYGLFILDVNIKHIVFSILYRHINVPMACKELRLRYLKRTVEKQQLAFKSSSKLYRDCVLTSLFSGRHTCRSFPSLVPRPRCKIRKLSPPLEPGNEANLFLTSSHQEIWHPRKSGTPMQFFLGKLDPLRKTSTPHHSRNSALPANNPRI